MTRHTITIIVEADEDDLPLNLPELRQGIARTISEDYSIWHDQHGYEQVSALVSSIRVDGSIWDEKTSTLKYHGPITPEIDALLMQGLKIQAIKQLRINAHEAGTPMGLAEAKQIVDNWK